MNISVCMATYNGARYLREAVSSILEQLGPDDEVIVVDDCSEDDTLQILQDWNEPRIKIFLNDRNRGINFSFDRSISLADSDYIFLADQDDVWIKNRVSLMVKNLLETGALLVTSNFDSIGPGGEEISYPVDGVISDNSHKNLHNIFDIFVGKTNYYGCAMAFRREILRLVLPIPPFVESHDLWIALAGNLIRSNVHIDERTLRKRYHDNNAASTLQRGLIPKLWSRCVNLASIVVLLTRQLSA